MRLHRPLPEVVPAPAVGALPGELQGEAGAASASGSPEPERTNVLGHHALVTPVADGFVVRWLEGHRLYVLDVRDPQLRSPDAIESSLVRVEPEDG